MKILVPIKNLLLIFILATFPTVAQTVSQSMPDQKSEAKTRKDEEKKHKEEARQREEEAKRDAKKAVAATAAQQKAEAKEKKQQAQSERQAQAIEDSVPINVNRNYDRFKDYTLSILNEMPVYTPSLNRGLTGPNFHMTAAIGYSGSSPRAAFDVVLGFNIRTAGMTPMWYSGPELLFLADGERLSGIGSTVQWQTYVNFYPILGNVQMVRTYAAVTMRYEDFIKLANSKNVEFRLGGIEATLLQRHLQAFRTLLEQK